ncbi:unnamed protein product [Closterium sp. NIES-53]
MVNPVANAGVVHTLEARLADARKRHADGEYGTIPLLIVELGIRSQWAKEHPSRPVSPRPVRNEGGVDDEVDSGARVSGNNGTKQRGVLKVDGGVDRSQARVQRSTAAACSSRADVYGRRHSPLQSGGGPLAMTHVTAGGIAPTYGYFKLSLDRITVALLQGRRDFNTWRESIEPQLEVSGLKGFADGTVPIPSMENVELRGEFRAAHFLTFMVISSDEDDTKGGRGRSTSPRPRQDAKPRKKMKTSKKTSLTKDVDNSSGKSRGDGEASCSMVGVVEPAVSLAPEAGKDFQAVVTTVQANPMAVLLDSGCSHHLMGTKAVFVDMAPSDDVKHARGFNGALQPVEGRGTVALQGGAGKRVLIPDVLYVTGVQANLLSARQLKESGVQLQGDGNEMLLVAATGEVLGRARYNGRLLCTNLRPCSTRSSLTGVVALRTIVSATKSTPDRLHARLAHVSVDTIKSSAKHEVATGLDITPSTGADPPCVLCVGAKLVRHTFPDKGSDAEEALAVVHIVLPKRGVPWKGVHRLRRQQGHRPRPDVPLQSVAEREMSTAVESMRTMLLHMGVQHHWWHLALRQAVWVRNCLERSTTPPGTNPYQLLIGKKPDLMLARVWGCMVQFMVPEQQRGGKLAPKARWGLHLGVSPESKGWEVLDLTDNKVVTSVEVIFYETLSLEVWKAKFGLASGQTQAHPPMDTSTVTVPLLAEVDELADGDVVQVLPPPPILAPPFPVADRPVPPPVSATGDEGSLEASPVASPAVDKAPSSSTRMGSRRARRPPERLSFHACLPPAALTAVYDEVDDDLLYDNAEEDEELPELDPDMHADPEHRWDIATMTVKEALASWKGEAVKAAMEEEIHSLVGLGTWELVERPRGVNIMKNRWVLTTKYRIDDTVERKKARLVVKGFTQVCAADYDETYSPVRSYFALRIFLSIVAVLDLNLMQLDMKNAFLQSKLDRVLYMYQPDYFDDGTGRVCKLLKQSPLLWYRALDSVLLGAGWKKSQVDEALYFKAGDIGVACSVLVYVDDLLAASRSPAMLKELKELLEAAFELREISPVVKYLGLKIVRDKPARKLWLHQQGYADKLRRRFIDEEQGGRVPKTSVLVDAYAELTFDDEEAQEREEEEYLQKVGSLQIAATTTRPDIAFACSKLGSGLHYVDADDAGDKQKRTSTSGYVFVYGGAAVSWSSSRIKCATLSSTESEYVAATNAGKEGRRLRFLLAEFELLDAGKPTILRVDNKSAITVTTGLGLMGNLKHMERRYASLQHMVRRGKFVLKYIPTTEQPADFLTKALHFPAFNQCSPAINQVRLADVGDGNDDVQ